MTSRYLGVQSGGAVVKWDPKQYVRYEGERERPFADLLARIDCEEPRRVVDVGCGTGTTTLALAARWPDAHVEGFDSSAEMIATATTLGGAPAFRVEDATTWQLPDDADVVVSNAVLQWIPTHRELLAAWAAQLPQGGWLGVQVPGNFGAPSHVLMRELAASPRWRERLHGVLRGDNWVASPQEYAAILLGAGLAVDVWETTYLHLLPGEDPVLEWVRGTGLRPVLAALTPGEAAEYERDYAAMLRAAYPPGAGGTVFPFRRIFAVAHR